MLNRKNGERTKSYSKIATFHNSLDNPTVLASPPLFFPLLSSAPFLCLHYETLIGGEAGRPIKSPSKMSR
jgi:hypothetical protein